MKKMSSHFLPREEASAIRRLLDSQEMKVKLDAPPGEVVELIELFTRTFEIPIELFWESDDPWSEAHPGPPRHVELHGAYVRYLGDLNALAVVLAHEIAHFLGPRPTAGRLACEQVADYWGCKEVLPALAAAGSGVNGKAGVSVLARKWSVTALTPVVNGSAGCGYTSHSCRVATMLAGIDGHPMPSCI